MIESQYAMINFNHSTTPSKIKGGDLPPERHCINLKHASVLTAFVSLLNITYLLSHLMSIYLFIPLVCMSLCIILWLLNRTGNIKTTVVSLLILLIPVSFIPLFGAYFEIFSLSWYHLALLFMIVSVIFTTRKKTIRYTIPLLLTLCLSAISLCFHGFDFGAAMQLITVVLFFCVLPIGMYLKQISQKRDITNLVFRGQQMYIISAISLAITIIFQIVFISLSNIEVGTYDQFGGGRTSYAATFTDYSFASLFLATAIIIVIVHVASKSAKIYNTVIAILLIAILLTGILATGGRTGLVSLAAVVILYFITKHIKNINPRKILIGSITLITVSMVLFWVMSVIRGGQSFLDGSNRMNDYAVGIDLFIDSPLLGVGFGADNYIATSGGALIPHNFFIQYLAQGGAVGLAVIIISLYLIVPRRLVVEEAIKFSLITVVVGAMFLPDVLHSRFLFILMLLAILSAKIRDREKPNNAYV